MISVDCDDVERNVGKRNRTSRWFGLTKIALLSVGSIQVIVTTTSKTGLSNTSEGDVAAGSGDSISSMSSSHLRTSDNDVSNQALLLNYPLVQGTLLESIPSAIFLPHRFVHQNNQLLELWTYNQQHASAEYMEFIPNEEEEGLNMMNDFASNTMIHPTPSSYVYIHLHKCGGTSMGAADYPQFKKVHKLYIPFKKRHKEEFDLVVDKFLQKGRLSDGFSSASPPAQDHVVLFSFIRDPAIKFLSGVGEVFDGYPFPKKVQPQPRWEPSMSPCAGMYLGKNVDRVISEEAVLQLLHCILDKMTFTLDEGIDRNDEKMLPKREVDSTRQIDFLDLHLLPQVLELYDGVRETPDIPVVLMDMKHMDTWFQNSHAIPLMTNARSHTNAPEDTKDAISTNNRRQLESSLLPKLSPTDIYQKDPYLLKRVCELYSMDVDMLKLLKTTGGLSVSTMCAL